MKAPKDMDGKVFIEVLEERLYNKDITPAVGEEQ